MGVTRSPTLTSKTVTTAGTAVALSTSNTFVSGLSIQAKLVDGDNTGNVFIGDENLDMGVKEGIELEPGDYYEPPIYGRLNLAELYLDADTNGDGVVILYWT